MGGPRAGQADVGGLGNDSFSAVADLVLIMNMILMMMIAMTN